MKRAIQIIILSLIATTFACSQNKSDKRTSEMTFKNETIHDFGKIEHSGNGVYEFEFKNTGKEPLIITNVKSSCGCTVPTYPREPIAKKKSGSIKVKYDTKRIGSFNKTITVYSNAKNSPVELRIKGEVSAKKNEISQNQKPE